MAKRATASPVNKKHLAREERERRLKRWILAALVVTLALVVGLLLYGWYDQAVRRPAQPLGSVNGSTISAGEVEARIRLLLLSGGELESAADFALDQLVEERLIQQEFNRRGLAIDEAEVQRALWRAFGYYPDGTPTPRPSVTPDPAAQATLAQAATATPTGAAPPAPTATSIPLPTPTLMTEDGYRAALREYLEAAGIDESDLRDILRASLIRAALEEAMRAELPRQQEQVQARHILVQTEAEAQILLKRLEQGESWDALAAEVSLDESNKDQGGELGWFGRNRMTPAFEEAAFSAKVGTIVGPVQTPFGWHLIDVEDRQLRTLEDSDYSLAASGAFSAWLEEQRAAATLEIPDDWQSRLLTLFDS
jgi:parvulin-like peptidyl-prolyl isomerase